MEGRLRLVLPDHSLAPPPRRQAHLPMRLTLYSDYSVRVLIYLAAHPARFVSTEEISASYGISNNHLVKVVNNLGRHGFLQVKRGRNGGIALGRPAEEIHIGEVLRKTEPDFHLAECFDAPTNSCPIAGACQLQKHLSVAHEAFMAVLDRVTVASLVCDCSEDLRRMLTRPLASAIETPRVASCLEQDHTASATT